MYQGRCNLDLAAITAKSPQGIIGVGVIDKGYDIGADIKYQLSELIEVLATDVLSASAFDAQQGKVWIYEGTAAERHFQADRRQKPPLPDQHRLDDRHVVDEQSARRDLEPQDHGNDDCRSRHYDADNCPERA
jgi:hypothetical protein